MISLSHPASRPGRGTRGTTLLDVLTAGAIMAAVFAIGAPNMIQLGRPYALRAATRQIATDLQATRLRAIARNARYRVTFDVPASTYTIEREESPGTFVSESGQRILPREVTLASVNPGNPIFDSRGMIIGAVTIRVAVPGSAGRTIGVNPLGATTIN